jgi:hypothetical protein
LASASEASANKSTATSRRINLQLTFALLMLRCTSSACRLAW